MTLLLPILLATGCQQGDPVVRVDGQPPQNLLMISLDTVRPDHLGRATGSDTTPRLDALIDAGVVLDDHLSCSNWTYDSMLCALGGRTALDMDQITLTSGPERLRGDAPLLANWLVQLGFQTALISSSYFLSSSVGTDRGYDIVKADDDQLATNITDDSLAVFQRFDPAAPWFLHAHYYDPHTPYAPPEPYRDGTDELDPIDWDLSTTKGFEQMQESYPDLSASEQAQVQAWLAALYDGELRYLDDEVGRLLDGLEAEGALDDTLIVLMTDHGEQFWEHTLWEHGRSLYGEEVDAIVSFVHPRLAPLRWTGPTLHQDVAPTLLDALGEKPPRLMTGTIVGQAPDDRIRLVLRASTAEVPLHMAEQDGVRMHYAWTGRKELYRTAADPDELDDIYDPDDPVVQALWKELSGEVRRVERLLGNDGAVSASP